MLNALSKCSWREFSDTNGRQVSDDVAAKLERLMRLLGFDLPHAASFDRRRLLISACLEFSSTANSRSNIMCFSLLTVVLLVVGRCAVWQTPRRPAVKPLELPFRMLETTGAYFGPAGEMI